MIQVMIGATSCRCGGSWAFLQRRASGAWEMIGCICHHALPVGTVIVKDERA